MVARDITGLVDRSRIGDRLTIDRYDLLLGLIPTAFVVAFLASRLLGLPFEAAVLGGARAVRWRFLPAADGASRCVTSPPVASTADGRDRRDTAPCPTVSKTTGLSVTVWSITRRRISYSISGGSARSRAPSRRPGCCLTLSTL